MTIDLSQLSPPDILEEKTDDELAAEWLADLATEDAALFTGLAEGDPLYSLVRTFAIQEGQLRARLNASVRAQALSAASGGSIDGLGALPNVARLVVDATTTPVTYEADPDYRGAVHRAPRSFGTGSKERYERAALLSDTRIGSVYAATPNPTELDLEWLPKEGVDPGDHPAIEANILAALELSDESGYEYRMLTDTVNIVEASTSLIGVTAHLHHDRGYVSQDVVDAAAAAIVAHKPKIRKVRTVIGLSAIYGLLDVDGVLKVDLTTPSFDIGPTPATAYEWWTLTISAGLASWV